mgnify:CR=1 FL=1
MYRYDSYDQSIVDARVEEFRDQVQRRLAAASSSLRKSGWAIAVSACARCAMFLPQRSAMPYSVTT